MKVKCVLAVGILLMATLVAGSAAANSIASVSTDKASYSQGETITVTVTNNCRGPLAFNGFWVENEKGDRVYSEPMLDYPMIMAPGAVFVDVWAQNCDDGSYAVPGDYVIMIDYESTPITITAVVVPQADVQTDKPSYQQGEKVGITVTNTGDIPVILNGFWVEDSEGAFVYGLPMLDFVQYLQPGDSHQYTWNQLNDNGEKVAAGAYSVNIEQDKTDIEIIEAVPVVQVSTDKAAYEAGEPIQITVTNAGYGRVVLTGFWVENDKGEQVYAPAMLDYVQYLNPGDSRVYVWDQTDSTGEKVQPGAYAIHAQGSTVGITINAQKAPQMGSPMADAHPAAHRQLGQKIGVMPVPGARSRLI